MTAKRIGRATPATQSNGAVRADARRNVEILIRAAAAVFDVAGVDASMRVIAERAGVGVGTIYRRFPKRADLIVAVFRHEVDSCVADAAILSAKYTPRKALALWVDRYIELVATKRGLAAALHDGDPAYDGLPGYFESRLSPALGGLLDAAAATGEIRNDVKAWDLLWAIAGLCAPRRVSAKDLPRRMIALLLDGLRTR